MRFRFPLAASIAAFVFCTSTADAAECPAGSTCVPKQDMDTFIALLHEKQCLQNQKPEFTVDPLTVFVDRDGRIYGAGSDPRPWALRMKWCGYSVEAKGETHIDAAMRKEPESGFRFRVKASMGYLPAEALTEKDAGRGLDGGVLIEPVFFHWANLNAYVGVRSFGGGVGFDVFRNVTLYMGYAMTWGTWRSNPHVALGFALW